MPVFYGAIDLSKNELRNAVVQNLGSAPSTPSKGQIYMDSTANILYWYSGSQWVAAQGGAGAVPSDTVTTLAVGNAAVPGVATLYARGDHAHGLPAFGAATADTVFGSAKSDGAATTIARSDHTHGNPALGTTPVTLAVGDAAAGGSATDAAKTDHRHGMPAFAAPTGTTTFGLSAVTGVATTLPRSDHTHGTPTHDNAAHSAVTLNSLAAPTASVSMNSQLLTNLAAPVSGGDATNKTYVDNLTAGLSWKEAVRIATTANIAQSGLTAIDGITPAANDRVLCKDQTTQSQNGIWLAQSGAWTRALDFDAAGEAEGAAVFVMEGTLNQDTAWVMTTNAPITIGTTSLVWSQFAGGGTVTAGAGMTQSGNTLNVIAGDTSLTVAADDVRVNTAVIASVASLASYVPTTRSVIAGAGMTGGGTLAADATLNVIAGDTSLTVAADSVIVNTGVIATVASVAAKAGKYAAALTGTASPETVTHNLNTRDIQLTVLNGSTPYTAVEVDWDATTVNTAVIRYNPNLGAGYRVVVVG